MVDTGTVLRKFKIRGHCKVWAPFGVGGLKQRTEVEAAGLKQVMSE